MRSIRTATVARFKLTYPACDVACAQDEEETIRTTTSGRIRIAPPLTATEEHVAEALEKLDYAFAQVQETSL